MGGGRAGLHGRTMGLSVVEEGGVLVVEGTPEEHLMSRIDDVNVVLETCFSNRARLALLYPQNLTGGFFDLSSGEAGSILQRLRNYGIRLALVCPPGSVRFSTRFREMLAEEERGSHFKVFEMRHAAREWLARFAKVEQ